MLLGAKLECEDGSILVTQQTERNVISELHSLSIFTGELFEQQTLKMFIRVEI